MSGMLGAAQFQGLIGQAQAAVNPYTQMIQQLQNAPPPKEPVAKDTLVRTQLVAVEPQESISRERRSLASRAAKVLGYKHFSDVIDKKESDERCAWEAAQAFAKLGFDPLDATKVAKYKFANCPWGHQWVSSRIEKYASPIPEFALSRAIELKEELPHATFEVDFLQANPDPFLVMVYGGIRYYIDVWDEPKFEGRRSV
jgi:hypothetical protein